MGFINLNHFLLCEDSWISTGWMIIVFWRHLCRLCCLCRWCYLCHLWNMYHLSRLCHLCYLWHLWCSRMHFSVEFLLIDQLCPFPLYIFDLLPILLFYMILLLCQNISPMLIQLFLLHHKFLRDNILFIFLLNLKFKLI